MICSKCGHKFESDDVTCSACGFNPSWDAFEKQWCNMYNNAQPWMREIMITKLRAITPIYEGDRVVRLMKG